MPFRLEYVMLIIYPSQYMLDLGGADILEDFWKNEHYKCYSGAITLYQ